MKVNDYLICLVLQDEYFCRPMSKQTEIVFIINPIAGVQKYSNIEDLLMEYLSPVWKPVFVKTRQQGHAQQIVLAYLTKGVKNFVAVGGDGTVSEVAAIVCKSNATLGIIPCGSGNGLARTLNIPLKIGDSVACINSKITRKIDVGTISNKYFFCTCGVGFDARIAKKFAKQNTRGLKTYIKTTLKEYFKYKPKTYKLKIDGEKYNRKAFLITIANAGQYGNNVYIAPKSEIDDGFLEVCIIKPFPLVISVFIGIRLFTKFIHGSKYLETVRGRKIEFRNIKNRQFHIDGDPIKLKGPVHINIIPKALKVFAPKKR